MEVKVERVRMTHRHGSARAFATITGTQTVSDTGNALAWKLGRLILRAKDSYKRRRRGN